MSAPDETQRRPQVRWTREYGKLKWQSETQRYAVGDSASANRRLTLNTRSCDFSKCASIPRSALGIGPVGRLRSTRMFEKGFKISVHSMYQCM